MEVMASLPEEVCEAIRNSIQSTHVAAEQLPHDISQQITAGASEAFTSGMNQAMLIAAVVMMVASPITLLILPNRIRPPVDEQWGVWCRLFGHMRATD
jgi:hypothetical protein